MHTLAQDARQALRLLAHNPGFAAATLLTIALGVGGTSAVFSVVYGVLLRPLPYPEPDRLVSVAEAHQGATTPFTGVLFTNHSYYAWERKGTIEELGAYSNSQATLTGFDQPQRLRGTSVTPSLFRLLGIAPAVGRLFTDDDARQGAAPVVVLSHSFWQDRFGGDRDAVGRTLTLDGRAHEIIGVTPAGFVFPGPDPLAFYSPYDVPRPAAGNNSVSFMRAVARLAPGVSPGQAAAEGTAAARNAGRPAMVTNMLFGQGGPVEIQVQRMLDNMTARIRPALLVLAGGIVLVLLIACANVANLFLSRGAGRSREFAVRAALGARRGRLLRQLITESLVISLAGGVLGVFAGWALTSAVPAFAPARFPRLDAVQVDLRFLGVAVIVSTFVGIAAGLFPAFRGSAAALAPALRDDTRTTTGRSRARAVLLAGEAALAVVLLVSAALLGRSFVALVKVDAGYDPGNVLLATLHLSGAAAEEGRGAEAVSRILERVRAAPGVVSAGASNMSPFGGSTAISGFTIPGRTTPDGQPLTARALSNTVTPGYAEALGMTLREGRLFEDADASAGVRPLIVNEAFVETYLQGEPRIVGLRFPRLFNAEAAEIVGIVGNVLPAQLDAKPEPQIYLPQAADGRLQQMTLAVKTTGDPVTFAPTLRSIVASTDPAAALDAVGSLASRVSESVGQPRFAAAVLGAFALLALALAATGLYGVLSYNVSQRRREMGVRAALGAGRGQIVALVLRQGLAITSIGLVMGLVAAFAATRLIEGLLFGVSRLDAVSFLAGPALLLLVAVGACLIPARRAASVDPAEALRAE